MSTNTPSFITLSRAWYGDANLTNRRDGALDQITLLIGDAEASLTLYGSCNGWRFEVFDDAAATFAPFAARILTNLAAADGKPVAWIETALALDGFTDATPLTDGDATKVPPSGVCPRCGEDDQDQLVWDDAGETITCQRCGTNYTVHRIN